MKKVLITGKNSYVGTSFKKWASTFINDLDIHEISLRDSNWHQEDFSSFDVIFHVAGIAHSDTSDVCEETVARYYQINSELTYEVAKKAKDENVKQFIFMSSMIVYGESGRFDERKMITHDTIPNPANFYGNSKLQGELKLKTLISNEFKVAIVRPPMIYGPNSKGNYPKLSKLAQTLPIFPQVTNERSMLYIENLCQFIYFLILEEDKGTFFPQNKTYVCTSDLVLKIAEVYKKKIKLTSVFNPIIRKLSKKQPIIHKIFGNFTYDLAMSNYKYDYRTTNFDESIKKTEKNAEISG